MCVYETVYNKTVIIVNLITDYNRSNCKGLTVPRVWDSVNK